MMASEDDCVAAIEAFGDELLMHPNVQGIGVGGDQDSGCHVNIYLVTEDQEDLPATLTLRRADGTTQAIPVRLIPGAGQLEPE
jgi:hypothetical protein